jgi:hypothetical protein
VSWCKIDPPTIEAVGAGSGVLRPGNQINHNVNLSQNAVLDPNGVGTLVGPAQPAFLLNRSDFWAQGVSIGLEFRY